MSKTKNLVGVGSIALSMALVGCGGSQATDMSGYNNNPNQGTNNMVSTATSLGAVTLGAKLLPIQGKATFITGVNVPGFSGGADIDLGKNPLQPNTDSSYNSKTVAVNFADIAGVGCNTVRIVLFSKLNGLKIDANGMVSGLDDTFVKNLSDLLSKAETAKLQVYVSLANNWSGTSSVKNPLIDVAARTAYLKNAVTPLVGKLRGRSSVLAMDLANELENEVAGNDGNFTKFGATWDQAHDFVKAALNIVKSVDPARLVTVSSGFHGSQNLRSGKFSKLGFDFYDFHVYDDKGNLPAVKDLRLDRPVMIGACGQKSTKADSDLQAKADVAFLTNSLQLGYAGTLISDYSKDSDNALGLLDKDGKHRPVVAQLQMFVANMPLASSASSLTK